MRSLGEYETFRSLLVEHGVDGPKDVLSRIRVNTQLPLFFKAWTYVDQLTVADGRISLVFNPSTRSPGPFTAIFELARLGTGQTFKRGILDGYMADRTYRYALPESCRYDPFVFRLTLDGCLAYQNDFDPSRDDMLLREEF